MTTNQPTVALEVLEDKLTGLAARYTDLTAQRAVIDEELEEIKAAIRDLTPGPDLYAAGDHTVVVAANRRFDEKRALALLPDAVAPLVTYPETRVDKDKLKALAPEVFEQAQVVFAERVSVK